MTRADFERLTAGQFVFTHMGTSYRSVCIVSLDLAAGTITSTAGLTRSCAATA